VEKGTIDQMPEREMSLRDHLEELRKRIFFVAIAIFIGTAVAFIYRDQVLAILIEPGFSQLPDTKPIFTEVTEMVAVTMKASLMLGLIFALPVIVYQVIAFIGPGLTKREKIYLFILLPFTILIFGLGVAFGYFVLFPPAFRFLFTFGNNVATPAVRIGSYMNVITSLLFWMGLIFEIPLVMFILARMGAVTPRFLSRFRRYALVLAFVLGAIITPTLDPVNQTLVAVPIVVLYEFGILLAKFGQKLRAGNKHLMVKND
jgi:sec-independent protein translocase protein TatC